jgi:steroid delta-isomerase-like uncharacterized protein
MFHRFFSTLSVAVLLCAFFSLAKADDKETANMAQMKKIYTDVVNKGNTELMNELFAMDFIEHEQIPGIEPNREGVKKYFKQLHAAFPDLKFTVDFMLAKDDKVVTYITISGTQKGKFMDIPASGKMVTFKGIDIVGFKNGKAVEHWGVTDSMTMMQQLGAIPQNPPKTASAK